MRRLRQLPGFTLPSVIIASVLMMILLTAALQIAAASSHALREQYYNQLAREAAESGIVRAHACTPDGLRAPWQGEGDATNYLQPGSACEGNSDSASTTYYKIIGNKPRIGLRYTIGKVTRHSGTGQQTFQVTGHADILRNTKDRSGNDVIVKTYSFSNIGQIKASLLTRHITMGYHRDYSSPGHPTRSFISHIKEDGSVFSFGDNTYGQLGDGSTGLRTAPVRFNLPSGAGRAISVYANNLSAGYALFVTTEDGSLYAAGKNDVGQLGVGSTEPTLTEPRKVQLPSGYKAMKIVATEYNTFVIAEKEVGSSTSRALFSMGLCGNDEQVSLLGRDCSRGQKYSSPGEVTLMRKGRQYEPLLHSNPDLNELMADRASAMVIDKNGYVYAWGDNSHGQLGLNKFTANGISTPEPIPSYASSGKVLEDGSLLIKSIATDGLTFYLQTRDNRVFASGMNDFGQLGSIVLDDDRKVKSVGKLKLFGPKGVAYDYCLSPAGAFRAPSQSAYAGNFGSCNNGGTTLEVQFTQQGNVIIKSRGASSLCLDSFMEKNDSPNGSSNAGIGFANCINGRRSQQWIPADTAGNRSFLLKTAAEGKGDYCLAAAAGNNPSTTRPLMRPCKQTTSGGKLTEEAKNFYLIISNPSMSEINLLDSKEEGNEGHTWNGTAGSVGAVSSDNGSVSFLAKRRSTDTTYVVRSLGLNRDGLLGGGGATRCTRCAEPVTFQLPPDDANARKVLNVSLSTAKGDTAYNNLYVITTQGRVYGAGSNELFQLGHSSFAGENTRHVGPLPMNNWRRVAGGEIISRPPEAKDIVSGGGTTMILGNDGRVYTVGNNRFGQLGSGSEYPRETNEVVPRPNLFTAAPPPLFY